MAIIDVDRQLRELAMTRWEDFKKVTGLDTTNFIICTKRQEGKSIRQIAMITKLKRDKVHRMCQVCP